MRVVVTIVRMFVGVLFIISGIVKANDPLGLGYKMQEFFEVWNDSLASSSFFAKHGLISLFNFLHEQSLGLSVLMITLEIIAGVALLIGWKRRIVLNVLLLLIIFFTFLTGYAFLSGKFKSCGCFGDCLPITPVQSFIKDLLLLTMIILLLVWQRYIHPLFTRGTAIAIFISALMITIAFQSYVLHYLPVVDCLPFKKGKNIAEQMKMPANAVADSFAMKFIYEKQGKRYEFSPEELPSDLASYKFIERQQQLIRKGNAEPPIKGFSLTTPEGNDLTPSILNEPEVVLVFAMDFKELNNWMQSFRELYEAAEKKNIPLFIVSPDAQRGAIIFASMHYTNVGFLSCDNTAVRTAARTVPTIFILKRGTIVAKESYRKMGKIVSGL
jgi:uncharacterized membrane protein YphA (DoxX/SURF4 family)/peroxiredoxin